MSEAKPRLSAEMRDVLSDESGHPALRLEGGKDAAISPKVTEITSRGQGEMGVPCGPSTTSRGGATTSSGFSEAASEQIGSGLEIIPLTFENANVPGELLQSGQRDRLEKWPAMRLGQKPGEAECCN